MRARHQRPVVGRQRTGEIAEGEDHHQAISTVLRGQLPVAMVKQRRADDDAQRIAGNQQAGGRDRDAEIFADIEQQAHDDEFGDADAEGAGGEGIESKRHGGFPSIGEDALSTRASTLEIVSPCPVNQTCLRHIFCEINSQMARPDINRSGEIEVFVRVVEAGSFSAAARALRMTPSAVSKLIARLEARLGARLVSRSTRKLQLTPEGAAFYDSGVRILADMAAAEREAAAGAAPRGRLRVNSYVPFGHAPADPAAAATSSNAIPRSRSIWC